MATKPRETVGKIYLTGGSSLAPGLKERIEGGDGHRASSSSIPFSSPTTAAGKRKRRGVSSCPSPFTSSTRGDEGAYDKDKPPAGKEYEKRRVIQDLDVLLAVLALTFALVGGIFLKNRRDVAPSRRDGGPRQAARLAPRRVQGIPVHRETEEGDGRQDSRDRQDQAGQGASCRGCSTTFRRSSTDKLWFKSSRKNEGEILPRRPVGRQRVDLRLRGGPLELPYMRDIELKSVEDVTEAGTTVKKFLVEGERGLMKLRPKGLDYPEAYRSC